MKFLGIIPARFQSTRFPGKPLVPIRGKPMILWVVERAMEVLEEVWVATDHAGIAGVVREHGGKAVMTAESHRSGTDRCAEAARLLEGQFSFEGVINIQGDEPFIRPSQIAALAAAFTPGVQIATLARIIRDPAELENPNKPKVVTDIRGNALYFSRSVIPYLRDAAPGKGEVHFPHLAHIGVYGFRKEVLQEVTRLPAGNLEKAESLEKLRWLENGYPIRVVETEYPLFGIDTPGDLERAAGFLEKNPL